MSGGARPKRNSATLLVECPDRKGIVAAIAAFVLRYDGNILYTDQHQAPELGLFLKLLRGEKIDLLMLARYM